MKAIPGKTPDFWGSYQSKKFSLEQAVDLIRSGDRIFVGSGCGEPQSLVRGLCDAIDHFTDIEIVRLLSLENAPLTLIANKTRETKLNIRSFYLGSVATSSLARNKRFMTPVNLSAIPTLFRTGQLPIHVAFIQTSPPDESGYMSLGISVDICLAAAQSADLVIAQVNSMMPRVPGRNTKLHVSEIDALVERDEPLLSMGECPEIASADIIAEHIAKLVDDGSTLQIALGATSRAALLALSEKNDLGIHTQYMTDDIMRLISKGVVTNRKKGFEPGVSLAGAAIGSPELYGFLNENPQVKFRPSDHINNPGIIARNHKMTALNVAVGMDLTGQAAADAFPYNHFCGVNGMQDFIRGAAQSRGGAPVIMMTSTTRDGKRSRISPVLDQTAVVTPRGDVHYVVTEYGAVNLFGKSLAERAVAMISVAHPDFRDELFHRAREMGLLTSRDYSSKFMRGVYPVHLEEKIEIGGAEITVRPSKPVDERRIQEHFYALDIKDVVARFFHKKTAFVRDEIKDISQIDYKNELTLLAVDGDFGFGRIVGIAEYSLEPDSNMAEVAFSITRDFQRKGMGKILLGKLAEAARENGIKGLVAYTSPDNFGMIKLFGSMPYETREGEEKGALALEFDFDRPKTS
ncbi:Acetyl-CoA hydrolase [Candidatus Desulfarcum epimagneticum]|uniref:Acetyl-CoA hydrolase n=1 Tax=uncultured Desulfobacteraceae bacterium TaxID=218296 RepID=A0A484HIR1_9BACT|nr:Acetyl-CoA hydrolase [uncultured Desulfobacteraceae bacterium]